MSLSSDNLPLGKQEFEIYLLIYAAHVDYEFTDDEKDFIQKRTNRETFDKMYELFLETGDFASLKLILKYKDLYYREEEEQLRLFELLKDTFKIDGEFSRVERVFVSFFQRMTKI